MFRLLSGFGCSTPDPALARITWLIYRGKVGLDLPLSGRTRQVEVELLPELQGLAGQAVALKGDFDPGAMFGRIRGLPVVGRLG